ncbi:YbcC family protein [Chloroflexus sp.]|uniref:YbcC family protein n=1 Tax=Chloroflexus sp. TaxID=1904827 RepID=UPI003C7906D1
MTMVKTNIKTMSVFAIPSPTLSREDIADAVRRAEQRIAPLWPLRNFVAVNPYLGLIDYSFEQAAHVLACRAGARMTLPRSFYAQAIECGRITDDDLAAALAEGIPFRGAPETVAALKAFARDNSPEPVGNVLPTVADLAAKITGSNWSAIVTDSISNWAGAYFDLGQSYWRSPWAKLPAYAAWRAEAAFDRTPQVRGARAFQRVLRDMPSTATETIVVALKQLQVPATGLEAYLHRLLLSIHGWASYARYLRWEAELYGGQDETLTDLLAIRLVWEVGLWQSFAGDGVAAAWEQSIGEMCNGQDDDEFKRVLGGDLLLQRAFEHAYRRKLFAQLGVTAPVTTGTRKRVQAAFCIDVRSEIFRRALETVSGEIETIGFAGFFGFPIEYIPLAEAEGGAQCPVLLTPQFVIAESVDGATPSEVEAAITKRAMRQRVAKAWRMFKFAPVSCFGFVGPVGLAYVRKLLLDTLGITRPVPHPATFGLDGQTRARVKPSLEPRSFNGRLIGMPLAQRIAAAAGALKAMSLTDNFARIVLLAGHGSTTVNNPHATGLDCGACGGHTGEANVRVAVQILNDPAVRAGLREHGIVIPSDTVFVAGLHDTTTDDVTIFDKGDIPASHADDLQQLERDLAAAGRLARAERAALLNVDRNTDIDRAVRRRSTDWSQVRPEWGLAGCAAFIAAPRERTAGISLDGRAFLHNYDWRQDGDFSVLELIMTAPMIVASWINLQYFGSTVDNRVFGSGNKTLHNVVGTLGVLEGNGGDLRVGLPWQSVHDGKRYVHEPIRLHVLIEAPIEAMTAIITKHEQVQQLLDNDWLYLFAIGENGKITHRYAGGLRWETCV